MDKPTINDQIDYAKDQHRAYDFDFRSWQLIDPPTPSSIRGMSYSFKMSEMYKAIVENLIVVRMLEKKTSPVDGVPLFEHKNKIVRFFVRCWNHFVSPK